MMKCYLNTTTVDYVHIYVIIAILSSVGMEYYVNAHIIDFKTKLVNLSFEVNRL